MTCTHCNQPVTEIGRNEYRVFYKCGCQRHKGVDWDWSTALIDGIEYELGTAGSYVLECPACQNTVLRQRITSELCLWCGKELVKPRLSTLHQRSCASEKT